jgi:hypothetical protein
MCALACACASERLELRSTVAFSYAAGGVDASGVLDAARGSLTLELRDAPDAPSVLRARFAVLEGPALLHVTSLGDDADSDSSSDLAPDALESTRSRSHEVALRVLRLLARRNFGARWRVKLGSSEPLEPLP